MYIPKKSMAIYMTVMSTCWLQEIIIFSFILWGPEQNSHFPFNHFWDISVWIKVLDRLSDHSDTTIEKQCHCHRHCRSFWWSFASPSPPPPSANYNKTLPILISDYCFENIVSSSVELQHIFSKKERLIFSNTHCLSQKKVLLCHLAGPSSNIQKFQVSVQSQRKRSTCCWFYFCFIDVSLLP